MFMCYRKFYLGALVLLGVALTAGVGFTGGVRRRSALPTARALVAADVPSADERYC